ncbi:Putative oxidoreductase SadH [Zhongshania aliphaticivorans]|uniref:Oxidoreductase SadH n=1 Tax=Zhongshania aliphaticivorans TaxID=1470434 RepID=A0A5S9N862_9GAMM|nr:SDR family NAD(P)-dependent oxidoreductase [Zhongshania aliphaticivorans]CAA0080231.1 Putative oxidoreductase SadH [Zhongshania aliphaticivorans]CAA0085771.1 Putative oxidoreductase SadH [Zhongshania aliphaticivorans]
MKNFKSKVAVITGGASGVGRAIAHALAKEGAKVVISDIEEKALDRTITELEGLGCECMAQRADVTNADSMKALVEAVMARFGAIHLVFANAGVGTGEAGNMWDYELNDWEWGFRVNTWGLIHSINAFMPKLVAQNEEAHFVVTGSGNGAFLMLPDTPIYTASKAAVQAITENLHYQLQASQSPVKVNALFPGPNVVNTGIFNSERNRPDALPGNPDKPDSGIHSVEDMKAIMAQYDMQLQTTEPEEVAEFAIQGIRDEIFWISPMSDKARAAFVARVDSILNKTTPVVPNVL